MNKEKVTVYISTCNRINNLKVAVESVLKQDYDNIELIICDDASTDETKPYCLELCRLNSQIKYIRNETNQGACATRNLGIFAATGKFITGLDDDDEFTSDRISYFINNWDDKFSFVCGNFVNKYHDEKIINYNKKEVAVYDYASMLFDNPASNQIFTLTSRLQAIGGFDIRVRRLQDWDTWLRLSYKYGVFLRLPKSTYIMNHDQPSNIMRVSKSYPFLLALNDLKNRNLIIYGKKNAKIMDYILALSENKMSVMGYFHFVWLIKKPSIFAKYIYQYRIKKKFS